MRKILALSLVVPVTVAALAGCAPEAGGTHTAATPTPEKVHWKPCTDLVAQVAKTYEQIGEPSPLKGWEDRMQCGEVSVPLNYDTPDGTHITLAISRLLPKRKSVGDILTNPGGPGLEGRTMPAYLAASKMAALANDRTLIGVDVRGTGGSTTVECTSPDADVPDGPVNERVALAYAKNVAKANTQCVEKNREFFEQLTTQNAARDLDQVRLALGDKKVDYFGASWGTELGAMFLSAFPDSVGRILLDSMIDVEHRAAQSLDDIAQAVAASPSKTPGSQAPGSAAARIFTPLRVTTRTALTCNAYTGASDAASFWSAHVRRADRFKLDLQDRLPHPVSGDLPGTSACAGWPITPKPLNLRKSQFKNLQIVAHDTETVTPRVWAERAHDLLGGALTTLKDGRHASLAQSESAAAAVEFFRSGTAIPEP